jgi:hypothetical protein
MQRRRFTNTLLKKTHQADTASYIEEWILAGIAAAEVAGARRAMKKCRDVGRQKRTGSYWRCGRRALNGPSWQGSLAGPSRRLSVVSSCRVRERAKAFAQAFAGYPVPPLDGLPRLKSGRTSAPRLPHALHVKLGSR